MKKAFVFLIALILLVPTITMAAIADIDAMQDNELLELYEAIVDELRQRGKFPYIELKNGASGTEVALLQHRLVELGYLSKDPTGKFDKNTTSAWKEFQKASGNKQNGIASVAEQELLFSGKAASKPTPTPKPTPKPSPTPEPRKAYGKFDFNKAARTPSEYKGTKVKINGRVMQVLGDSKSGFEMRVATKGRYDNIVYIYTLGNHPENLLEGDKVTFYCVMMGDHTYESVMGQSITLPLAQADFYN